MSDLTKEIASTVVRIKTEMRKASAKPKKDNSQADLFEDEGGRRYSRAYRRSKEKELQAKRKSGGPKVMGKAQFASRSEAGRYAANQRWKGQGKKGKGNADTAQLVAYRQAGNTKDAKLTEQKIEQRLAAEGKTSPAERMAAGLRDFKGIDNSNRSGWHVRHNDLKKEFNNSFDKAFSEKTLVKAGETLVERGNGSDKLATKEDIAFGAETSKYLKETLNPLFDQVDQVLTDLENGQGDRDTHFKTLKSIKTKTAALAKKTVKDQKTAGHFPANKEDSTVRSMTYTTKALIFDNFSSHIDRTLKMEIGTDRNNPYTKPISKGKSFASRSEAGRYAANMRWKGQGQSTAASAGSKTPKQKYDFSPQDYKMVRDAMPQLSADDAKKLTQHLLDNNAFGDTSEMSNQEMSNEFALYLDDALGGGGSTASSEPRGKSPSGLDRGRDILDNDTNDAGDTVADLNSRYQNDDEYIAFEDLPKGGFREDVIAAFIDRKAAGYYDEPGRLKGPYDRPSSQMTDKGYAKARAHALKGHPDGRESDLEDYWDDNYSVFWDEYDGTAKAYAEDVGEYQ
jgi:hypothetical protein